MYKHTDDEFFNDEAFRNMLDSYEDAMGRGQPVLLDADELADIADFYQMTGQADEADEAISLALNLSPGAVMPLIYKIHEALYYGETDEAERLLGQIVEKDCAEYVYAEGEIMLARQLPDEADRHFEAGISDVPDDELQDYIIDVASIFQDFGYSETAMKWMKRAEHEDSDEYKELMGRMLFGLGRYKDSEAIFNELIDANPFAKRYWNALASAQFMNEEYADAVTSSEYAIAIDPQDPEGLLAKANGLFRLNNNEEALTFFRRYTELVPDDEFALLHQGTCLVNMGRTEEAIRELKRALDCAPDDSPYLADIYQELAFAYGDAKQYDKALEWLEKTDDVECDHTQMKVVKGHLLLASGRTADAQACFQEAVASSDKPHQTLLRIIVSLYDNQYLEATYKLFKKFFGIMPDSYHDGYAYMALCCYDLKRWDEFMMYLDRACQVNPKECKTVLAHLFPENMEPEDYYAYMAEQM